MRFTTLITLLATSQSLVLAQSQTPACIKDCTTKNAVSSQCNGDETGAALDKCLCNTFAGATAMFTCVKACPAADQAVFAADVPASCRSSLLPGVTPASSTSGSDSGSGSSSTPTASSGGQGSSTTTGSPATKTTNAGAIVGGREAVVAAGLLVGAAVLL
ncbi:hypothetical protein QBC47DRAFT_408421 [Echria macrotheca]|uniref:CFEM domain-containing protein n=1 Tax=Echria macrotheca TaxID=438768 RepID=A0AAJ0BL85_9PEZI|nr:hypothetical protein QBC47DRAFT_408421 [Echria macrotheca]